MWDAEVCVTLPQFWVSKGGGVFPHLQWWGLACHGEMVIWNRSWGHPVQPQPGHQVGNKECPQVHQ